MVIHHERILSRRTGWWLIVSVAFLASLSVVEGNLVPTAGSIGLATTKTATSDLHNSSSSSFTPVPLTTTKTHKTHKPSSTHHRHPSAPEQCDPLPLDLPPQKLCDHIVQHCPSSGRLDYLHFYYCSGLKEKDDGNNSDDTVTAGLTFQRIGVMLVIFMWIAFLFSCLGLVASDFFCPNLGTLASRLGMNESTAGVTFLALGNGSPDVFSTFSAMSSGSGSLAIGELLGAATFIVSVVAGSMMLIAPFKVQPYTFLRDVGFFTVAVGLVMTYLYDGKLTLMECLLLVALYAAYATTVILGSLWEEHKRRRRVALERDNSLLGNNEEYPSADQLAVPQPHTAPAALRDEEEDVDPFEVWARNQGEGTTQQRTRGTSRSPSGNSFGEARSPARSPLPSPLPGGGFSPAVVRRRSRFGSMAGHMPRHSLLGAIEFRDVVASLSNRQEVSLPVHGQPIPDVVDVAMSRDPDRFLPHPHSQRGHHTRVTSLGTLPTGDQLATSRPTTARRITSASTAARETTSTAPRPPPTLIEDPWKEHGENDGCEEEESTPRSAAPPTLRLEIPPTPVTVPAIIVSQEPSPTARWSAPNAHHAASSEIPLWRSLRHTLFPSLHHWKSKSLLGWFLSIVNAPPLFLFTITLPVVDDEAEAQTVAAHQEGNVKLLGDESPLYAAELEEDSPTDIEEENVLDLSTGTRTPSSTISDPWKEREARSIRSNKRRDLEVASALRRLPRELSFGQPSPARKASQHPGDVAVPEDEGDGVLNTSVDSKASQPSDHVPSPKARMILTVTQCLLAPPFVLWTMDGPIFWGLVAGLVLSSTASICSWRASTMGGAWYSPSTLTLVGLARCSLGFIVSIAWISTVVNEVVAILQAVGLICGLSDAILGLTVFAAGNSLADLVADVTIARAGYPVMAISACFAGPLLNILLGIGLSGTYLLASGSSLSTPIYHIDLSPTLLSSGVGLFCILVCILIFAIYNGFELGRKMGWSLIAGYGIIMTVNISVEVWYAVSPS